MQLLVGTSGKGYPKFSLSIKSTPHESVKKAGNHRSKRKFLGGTSVGTVVFCCCKSWQVDMNDVTKGTQNLEKTPVRRAKLSSNYTSRKSGL
jgi:hypothetical protein